MLKAKWLHVTFQRPANKPMNEHKYALLICLLAPNS